MTPSIAAALSALELVEAIAIKTLHVPRWLVRTVLQTPILHTAIAALVEKAVAEEREECAEAARGWLAGTTEAPTVEAAIRERGKPA